MIPFEAIRDAVKDAVEEVAPEDSMPLLPYTLGLDDIREEWSEEEFLYLLRILQVEFGLTESELRPKPRDDESIRLAGHVSPAVDLYVQFSTDRRLVYFVAPLGFFDDEPVA